MSTPARFFFVTEGRVGIDFGLLDAASRPLRENALKKLLSEGTIATAEAYREAIDDRLFGLGRERYNQLVNLLLQLRRPLLAKDLDPVKVSDTLTAGLRPVDDALVLQAARDFENLAEIQALLNALMGADTAVRNFLREYTSYLRAHARDRVDHVSGRIQDTATHCETIMEAAGDRRTAERQLTVAQQERDAGERRCNEIDARLTEFKNHDAIKKQDGLKELRERVRTDRLGIAGSERLLNRAQESLATLKREAGRALQRHDELRKAASRHTHDLMDAAQRCGILHDDDTLDLGAELDTQIAGRGAARRSELQDVQDLLGAFEDATKGQEREQEHCDTASGELTETERQSAAAAEKLTTARIETGQELDDFISRWSGREDTAVLVAADGDVLRAAINAVEEPEAAPLPEVFHTLTDGRRTSALTREGTLKRARHRVRQRAGSRQSRCGRRIRAAPRMSPGSCTHRTETTCPRPSSPTR